MNYEKYIKEVRRKNPGQKEFLQSVEEVLSSVWSEVEKDSAIEKEALLDRLTEPERIIIFRVPWVDDKGDVQVNRGFRVQFNSALGPYKGGLRFHPTVNLSILKFLGFEQTFKNALTGLPMGGGKGGSDFDPKGKSDGEVMRFCQSFMQELFRHIGPDTDVPAGDIGVGGREIGYLFGQYKKLANAFDGTLTGKGASWGGSLLRPEATGYGLVYFTEEMLITNKSSLKKKRVLVSGSGNVAQYAVQKLIELGATVLTMSDSDGYVYDKDGFDEEKLAFVMDLKNNRRGRISEYVEHYKQAIYVKGKKPWSLKADIAMPCATQNEIEISDAKHLVKNGIGIVSEGANMPCTIEATNYFIKKEILVAPSKASNAGGVSVSGLEMSQNAQHLQWSASEVDTKLRSIMKNIHAQCVAAGTVEKKIDYVRGANIAGVRRVLGAMRAQGIV